MRGIIVLVGLGLALGVARADGDPFAFVPDGGRGLFARVFPTEADRRAALAAARNVTEWETLLAERDLSGTERRTLAAYLAAIAPRDPAMDASPAALPPDGRDLALAQCQSCHSLFSGYLMHRRDRNGWLVIFASPFHHAIPMTEAERAIFADYSAINMPLRVQDVPPELRF